MDAERIGVPLRDEHGRLTCSDDRVLDDGAGFAARDQRPVAPDATVGKDLAQVRHPFGGSSPRERAVCEADDRDGPERASDRRDAGLGGREVGMGPVVERAMRFHGRHLCPARIGHTLQLQALGLQRLGEIERSDVLGAASEPSAVDIRGMRADPGTCREAGADDAAHRGRVACMAAAGDVHDVGEPVELGGLAVLLAAIEVEEHRHPLPHQGRAATVQGCRAVGHLHPAASLLTVHHMNARATRHASKLFPSLLGLVAAFLFVLALPGCAKYDELVEKDQVAQQKWGDYEATLQRRSELIPNLVNTVKASASYEKDTLEKITQARASATSVKLSADDLTDPAKVKAFQEAQDKISSSSISRLLVSNENYPKLQASGQFGDLMKQLEGTENRILRSREQYNSAVKDYNSELLKVSGSVVNKATGQPFKPRVYFSAAPESMAAPKVSF